MKKRSFLSKRSPQQVLVSGFALLIGAGTLLLSLPVSAADGRPLGLADALFTATSAACVTGLAVADTGTHFSLFGQIVLLLLIQAGGIGFMTMTTWFALVFGRKISFKQRLVLKESFNQHHTEGIVRLIRKVALYSLLIEACGTVLFAARWIGDLPPPQALYHGLFHAVSIFNNAGFDLVGGFAPYVGDYYFNLVSIVLVFLGSVGFIVLSDLIEYPKIRKLSLHSKVVLIFSGALVAIGTVMIFIFEYTNADSMGPLNAGHKLLSSLFHSTSLRSAGTSTLDIGSMRQATQFFMILMMFIGAAPGSTGGGIKVTTFAILMAAVFAMIRGKEDVNLFRSRIAKDLVYKSITVTFVALFVVAGAALALCVSENQPFLAVLFETVSAFGTVGLSTGLTQQLSGFGKSVIILLMFAGRLGPFTIALALQAKAQKELYRHPEGKIIIG